MHSAGTHCGVECDTAVYPVGSLHPGVPYLFPAARQRTGQRSVPAMLLQTGVQSKRLRTEHFPAPVIQKEDCSSAAESLSHHAAMNVALDKNVNTKSPRLR